MRLLVGWWLLGRGGCGGGTRNAVAARERGFCAAGSGPAKKRGAPGQSLWTFEATAALQVVVEP